MTDGLVRRSRQRPAAAAWPGRRAALVALLASALVMAAGAPAQAATKGGGRIGGPKAFKIEEATIADIQAAIRSRRVTTTDIVEAYLERIKAYNGTCVSQPEGILGPVSMIPDAGKLNALMTLNLRPAARRAWGFDDRKARSMTDAVDDDPQMPDALEIAARQDRVFSRTRRLAGPLHGVVVAIKDQYDTFDMRTTSGGDALYANDRPPDDAAVVERLRDAGAIILAKANLDEYAGGAARSSFGGTQCNAYDTERDPGGSSGGSAVAVAANFVTCAIGEETGGSIIKPAQFNNTVGMAPTRELVSAEGMIQQGLSTRVGPMCRTVADTAAILNAFAGYDPEDELTAFSVNRMPSRPYSAYADTRRLRGMRIGVVREYMDKALFTVADEESIDIVDRGIDDLRDLGATIVDPGEHGALFQGCVDKHVPRWRNQLFMSQFRDVFPVDATGAPTADHIPTLVEMWLNPSLVPHTAAGQPSIRNLGPNPGDVGDARYNFDVYLRERGDANIKTLADLVDKANFWEDPRMDNRRASLANAARAQTLSTAAALQTRFTMQVVVHQCFALMDLDAVVYPAGNIPPGILTSPEEPSVNNRGTSWNQISSRGFPAMTVPAGFTTRVHDRAEDGTLLPAKAAALPVGIEFLGLPFSEPTLLAIGAAYEGATRHRRPPAGFGPVR